MRVLPSHRPGAVLGAASLLSALGVTAIVAPSSLPALGACVVGVVGLTVGLTRRLRPAADFGVVGLLVGVVVLAWAGTPMALVLAATAGTVLAWEFGAASFDIEPDLRGGSVERAELIHVAAVTLVTVLVAGVAGVVYRTVTVGPSVLGVTLLLVGATALGLATRG